MIHELGPLPRARVIAAAHAADRDGRGVALLIGDGWGDGWGGLELGIAPVEEHRVPHGPDAMDRVEALLDGLAFGRERGWNGRPAALQWVGYLAYEAARSLEREAWTTVDERKGPIGAALVLRRFGAIARRDERTGIVAIEGDDRASIDALATLLTANHPAPRSVSIALDPVDDDDVHRARIETALALIARGDLYQVNVARTFVGTTDARATELLQSLLTRATARFGAAIDLGDHALASSSPELFLDVDGGRVRTSPIKGTRPRGHDATSDDAHKTALANDPKERAELTMVIDLERNDLGRFAEIGSVRVLNEPHIETSRTVHHRVADVVARHRASLGTIVRATFPSGSITGAPKIRAMEVIASLERDRRGLYCGAILRIGRDGRLRASMAIRTLVVDRATGSAVYQAGGGIVADSDPAREVLETLWKARQVLNAAG